MNEEFFVIFGIQETWESIILQIKFLFDPERFFFWDAFKLFFDKVLSNPLASIVTLLALIGLPYTLLKAKQSSAEADERLDQLMNEMKDFEFEKPLIDLQDKFKGNTFNDSSVIDYEQDALELNFEKSNSGYREEDSILHDIESTSFAKQITLDQEVTDDFLSAGSIDLQPEPNNKKFSLSPLPKEVSEEEKVFEEEDVFEEAEVTSYVDSSSEEDEDLVSVEAETPKDIEVSSLVDLSVEEEHANHFEDDLKAKMEQAIKKLTGKYVPQEKRGIHAKPFPSTNKKVKKLSLLEEKKREKLKETSPTSPVPLPPDSPNGEQKELLKKSHVITHLNSFQKNLENRLNLKTQGLKKKSNEPQQEQNSSSNPILKPTGITCLPQNMATDKEYQQSLESFLLLRDQKKPE